ncbi:hypothetical protein [Nonomuraea aridisoli]|uniref:Uncharacterized protein n=1 Tax=Nonomuraea aridisoli TaxID=2070368 RepID=A0A2W2DYX7_9ACTN|nr:hypothetical protein [Nonomuraea aridisoli]PZG17136.1 hypothetical protein C1J01_19030 [Nonomuraea aridisoli]
MARTNIFRNADDSETLDGWFDPDHAERYEEATRLIGIDCVGVLTGNPAEHQTLYRTPGGRWVLHRWSQWEGDADLYEFLSTGEARIWLITCRHDDAVAKYFGELSEEAGPGVGDIKMVP